MRHECSLEFRYSLHRFHDGIISLLLTLCGPFGGLFCGGLFGFRRGRALALGLALCLFFWRGRSLAFGLRLGFALGPRGRRLGGFGPAGEDFGDADHRELVAGTALTARILAPALL